MHEQSPVLEPGNPLLEAVESSLLSVPTPNVLDTYALREEERAYVSSTYGDGTHKRKRWGPNDLAILRVLCGTQRKHGFPAPIHREEIVERANLTGEHAVRTVNRAIARFEKYYGEQFRASHVRGRANTYWIDTAIWPDDVEVFFPRYSATYGGKAGPSPNAPIHTKPKKIDWSDNCKMKRHECTVECGCPGGPIGPRYMPPTMVALIYPRSVEPEVVEPEPVVEKSEWTHEQAREYSLNYLRGLGLSVEPRKRPLPVKTPEGAIGPDFDFLAAYEARKARSGARRNLDDLLDAA